MTINYMISMGEGGSINADRVIAVASMASAPVKRFVDNTPPDKLLNLTYGYPRRSIVVFDNGFVAITRYPVEELDFAIRTKTEVNHDGLPF
ncbi:MAG: DUF370 domain-containing protein [Chloroflexota bacterium]